MKDFLTALGLVLIIEGIPYFASPGQMRLWIAKLVELPDVVLRRTGFVLMLVGLSVIFLVRG